MVKRFHDFIYFITTITVLFQDDREAGRATPGQEVRFGEVRKADEEICPGDPGEEGEAEGKAGERAGPHTQVPPEEEGGAAAAAALQRRWR